MADFQLADNAAGGSDRADLLALVAGFGIITLILTVLMCLDGYLGTP